MKSYCSKKIVMNVTAALAFGLVSTGGGHAFAADADSSASEHMLDETVVTATRTPNKELKADANITVITGKDIERRHYTDLTQALRDVPGITINEYAPAGYNNSNALYINGSNHVAVLIDGVRQNYAGGTSASLSSAMKDLSGIDRIEVLHGSASTLYGSDAKGGVINIITKKAQGMKTTLGIGYGSYSRQQYSIANAGGENGWDWRVKYQKDKSGDFKDAHGNQTPSHLDADSIHLHLGKQLSKASYLSLNYRSYKDSDRYQARYEKEMGLYVNRGNYDHFDGSLIWNVQLDDTAKNQMSVSRSKYAYDLHTFGLWTMPAGTLYEYDIQTYKFSDQFDKQLGNHLLTAGFEFTKDDTTNKSKGLATINDRTLINRSFYLQDQWSILPTLKLTAGIRHDSNSSFGSHSSPSVSLGYDIDPMTHAYASYSAYFITPTPSQLYTPIYGNANLKPESGNTREIGIARDFGSGLSLTASYFMRHSKNRIWYHPVTFVNINVGDEDAHGWSLQLDKRVDSHWRAHVGYTQTHTGKTEQYGVNIDGILPRDQWNIGVDYRNRDFDSSLLARGMVGLEGPSDAIGKFLPTDNYWVVDLAMNYRVADATKVYLKVNNLFNQFYAEKSNARASWFGAAEQWWTAPGRNFMIGVEQSF